MIHFFRLSVIQISSGEHSKLPFRTWLHLKDKLVGVELNLSKTGTTEKRNDKVQIEGGTIHGAWKSPKQAAMKTTKKGAL